MTGIKYLNFIADISASAPMSGASAYINMPICSG